MKIWLDAYIRTSVLALLLLCGQVGAANGQIRQAIEGLKALRRVPASFAYGRSLRALEANRANLALRFREGHKAVDAISPLVGHAGGPYEDFLKRAASNPTQTKWPTDFTPDIVDVVSEPNLFLDGQRLSLDENPPSFLWSNRLSDAGPVDLYNSGFSQQQGILRQKTRLDAEIEKPFTSQNRAIRNLLIPEPGRRTYVVPAEEPIDLQTVIAQQGESDLAARALSDPDVFQFNMERLRNRKHSRSVSVYDFAPKSEAALDEMGLSTRKLSKWKRASDSIKKITTAYGVRDTSGLSSVKNFLADLQSQGEDGSVIVVYGHSDGRSIYVDLGNQSTSNVQRLTPELLREAFEPWGSTWLPTIVLLSCETQPVLAKPFLDSGAPLVWATDLPIEIRKATKFIERYLQRVFREAVDAVDAIYDTSHELPILRFGPSASANPKCLTDPTWPQIC